MSSTRQQRRNWQNFREQYGETLAEFKQKFLDGIFNRLPTDEECDSYEAKKKELTAPLGRRELRDPTPEELDMSGTHLGQPQELGRSDPQHGYVVTITKKHEWDMGHRLPQHEGKCRHLHGHRYVAEIDITGIVQTEGPSAGMVADFSDLKEILKATVDEHWDHKTMLREDDEILEAIKTPRERHYLGIFTVPWTPTAENIAVALMKWLDSRSALEITRVRIYETPNGWAEVRK